MRCEDVYGPQLSYYNPNTGNCTAACPEETPLRPGSNWCVRCEEAHPGEDKTFWDPLAGACVEQCPELTSYGLCVTCYEQN